MLAAHNLFAATPHVKWQWKTSAGWKDYDAEACQTIEDAYQAHQGSCVISTIAGEYQVNMQEGFQQSLREAKLTRQVRRVDAATVNDDETAVIAKFAPPARRNKIARSAASGDKSRRTPGYSAKMFSTRTLADFGNEPEWTNSVFDFDGGWNDPGAAFSSRRRLFGSEANLQTPAVHITPAMLQQFGRGELFNICEAMRTKDLASSPQLYGFLVQSAQKLINKTRAKIWTHDRKTRAKRDEDRPNETPKGFKVISVDVITNEAAKKQYERARARICEDDPVLDLHIPWTAELAGDSVKREFNEWMLFHGTSPRNAQSIRSSNLMLLDQEKANNELLCGAGFYFTESPTKADEYASPDNAGEDRTFVMCRVLGGKVHYTDEEFPDRGNLKTMLHNGSYNSVLNDREQCRGTFKEFVVVRSEQVLPECIIRYRQTF